MMEGGDKRPLQRVTTVEAYKYPPLVDSNNPATEWAESLLQNCSEDRMLLIAKKYLVPNSNTLTKEVLYHTVFDHMLSVQDCTQCGGNCDPMNHIFHCNESPVYPTTNARELRPASSVASPSRTNSNVDPSTSEPALLGRGALPSGSQPPGPGASHDPPPPTPVSFGPATRRRAGSVRSISALTILQEDKLRVVAEIEEQEGLAAARRLQDLEDPRKELLEDDEIDAAVERQRQQLSYAAKERFVVAEGAHLRRLQELRDAASAGKGQPPSPGASGGPSRVQRQGLPTPPGTPPVNLQEHDLHEGGENPASQDEALDNEAPLSQLGMLKLMTDSMVSALEKVEKRNGRIPLFTLVNSVPTSFLREAKYQELVAGMSRRAPTPRQLPAGATTQRRRVSPP